MRHRPTSCLTPPPCTGRSCGRTSATRRASLRRTPGFAVTAIAHRRARHRREHGGVLGDRLRPASAAAVPRARSPCAAVGEDARLQPHGVLAGELPRLEGEATVVRAHGGVHRSTRSNLVGGGEPRRLERHARDTRLLPMLGVPPFAGARSRRDDPRTRRSRSSATASGRRSSAAIRTIIGRPCRLDGTPYTIIGVMPPSFRFPDRDAQAWTPLLLHEQRLRRSQPTTTSMWWRRLRPGVTLARATRRSRRHRRAARATVPEGEQEDQRARVVDLRGDMSERSRLLVLALCGAARLHPAARLREPRQPAARARHASDARARGSHGVRRRTRAARPAAHHREPRARASSAASSAWRSPRRRCRCSRAWCPPRFRRPISRRSTGA